VTDRSLALVLILLATAVALYDLMLLAVNV